MGRAKAQPGPYDLAARAVAASERFGKGADDVQATAMVFVGVGKGRGQVDRRGAGVPDGDDEPLVVGQQVDVGRAVGGVQVGVGDEL